MGIAKALLAAAKWLGPKLMAGLVKTGKVTAKGIRAANAYVVPKIQYGIKYGGNKIASVTKNPFISKSVEAAIKIAASDKVVNAIVRDLAFKTAKTGISKLPGGKVVRPFLDAADYVIGIPFF